MVLCGKITDSRSAYVGEQLAKIGPSDAHKRISHKSHQRSFAFVASVFALFNHIFSEIPSHNVGRTNVDQ